MDFIDPLHRDNELKEIGMSYPEPLVPTTGEKRAFWVIVFVAIIGVGFLVANALGAL